MLAALADRTTLRLGTGVTQFNLRVSMGGMPTELVERTIRLLGEQVLPRFR